MEVFKAFAIEAAHQLPNVPDKDPVRARAWPFVRDRAVGERHRRRP